MSISLNQSSMFVTKLTVLHAASCGSSNWAIQKALKRAFKVTKGFFIFCLNRLADPLGLENLELWNSQPNTNTTTRLIRKDT